MRHGDLFEPPPPSPVSARLVGGLYRDHPSPPSPGGCEGSDPCRVSPPTPPQPLWHPLHPRTWCYLSHNRNRPPFPAFLEEGGGGGLEYQKWPNQIFLMVNFVRPHDGHSGLGWESKGGGGGSSLREKRLSPGLEQGPVSDAMGTVVECRPAIVADKTQPIKEQLSPERKLYDPLSRVEPPNIAAL